MGKAPGIPDGTVGSRMSRGVERLRLRLAHAGAAPRAATPAFVARVLAASPIEQAPTGIGDVLTTADASQAQTPGSGRPASISQIRSQSAKISQGAMARRVLFEYMGVRISSLRLGAFTVIGYPTLRDRDSRRPFRS